MTREEAIKILESECYIADLLDLDRTRMVNTSLDLAIEALEQQPCEDAISRTELLARIDAERKHLLDIKMDGAEHIVVHHARRIIEDMPSVTPTRPKGEWIAHPKGIYTHLVCSKCLSNAPYNCKTNYCPGCGADMRINEE